MNVNKEMAKFFGKSLKEMAKVYDGNFRDMILDATASSDFSDHYQSLLNQEAQNAVIRAAKAASKGKKAPKPVELDADGNPILPKRGRPKGSKNKPKIIPAVSSATSVLDGIQDGHASA
jgi:hypothetical protein